MKAAWRTAPCLLLAACAKTQSPLGPASDQAQHLYGLWTLMFWTCGIAYLLVMAFLGAALWRHRQALAQAQPDPEPKDAGLKLGLGAWSAVITVGFCVLAGASFLVDRALANQNEAGALQVRITGQQWWWRIQYRDPVSGGWIESANELHLPLGRPAQVQLQAADVIHSFWIPNLSGKLDMVPGRTNTLYITPRRTGWFRGQCAEFCGLQHAQMALDAKVETPEAFASWLSMQAKPAAFPSESDGASGERLFTTGTCAQCHSVRGTPATGRAGPDLTHVGSRISLAAGAAPFSRGALMGWIAQPQAIKPGAEMPPSALSPTDALAVTAYLEGLR